MYSGVAILSKFYYPELLLKYGAIVAAFYNPICYILPLKLGVYCEQNVAQNQGAQN